MAFPVVQTKAGGGSAGSTSHAITLPSGVTAGDLLLVVFANRSTATASTTSTGWTKLGQFTQSTLVGTSVYTKVATGSDALTITTTSSQRSTHESYRITGSSGTVYLSAGAGASAANPNSASLTPAGGAKDYLWISASGAILGNISASAAPTNYTNLTNQVSGAGTGAAVYMAERQLNATSEDPGAFTAATTGWAAYTLAVEPTGGGGTSYTLTADPGSYSLSGQTANLTSARSIVADPGSYALTGQDATMVYTAAGGVAYTITADAGSYALTGQVANLTSARRIQADPGSYALTGQAANLTSARRITADPGSYALSGQTANLTSARRVVADPGSYALTGNAATLTYTPSSVAYTLTAAPGSYVLTGQAANLVRGRVMIASPGSYALTGQAANLSRGLTLQADSGAYALTGGAATLQANRRISAESGEYSLIGAPANLVYGQPQPLFFIIG